MKLIAGLLSLLLTPVLFGQISQSDVTYVNKTYAPATALLYSQDYSGGMRMRCTATAYEKTAKGYKFVTAAHCGCDDDTDEKLATPQETFFYITADAVGEKKFLSAKPIACGYRHVGDDFFELEVDTTEVFSVVPLGKDPQTMDSIVNVASPIGLGKQVFLGSVSAALLDRPIVEDDINWTNAILLQLFGTDGGSSGSAVVCIDQHAICAFVVGTISRSSVIAMPVSRLLKMNDQIKEGKYKYWKANTTEAPSASSYSPKSK